MSAVTSLGVQWKPISSAELRGDESDYGNSSPLASRKHYTRMAKKGRAKLAKMGAMARIKGEEPKALETDFPAIKQRAWEATRSEWGGQTIHPATGQPMDLQHGYAVTVREPGQEQLSVHINASQEKFSNAMEQARRMYMPQLRRENHALGVFRDETTGRIDIDPVAIADRPVDARAIGAYSHASGGAYDFSTGNGVWMPHVSKRGTR